MSNGVMQRTYSALLRGKSPSAVVPCVENGRVSDEPDSVESQIMLSYRIADTGEKEQGGDETVFKIKSYLQSKGFTVFVGETSLQGGQKWGERIQAAITNCQVFIALCSPRYGSTEWTFRELSLADNKKKPILPVWHSGPFPPPSIEIYLSAVHHVPQGNKPLVERDFEDCMQQVLTCLKRMGCEPLYGGLQRPPSYSIGKAVPQQAAAQAQPASPTTGLAKVVVVESKPSTSMASPSQEQQLLQKLLLQQHIQQLQQLQPQQPPQPQQLAASDFNESNARPLCGTTCWRRSLICCAIFVVLFIVIIVVATTTSLGGDPPASPAAPPSPPPA